MAVVPEVTAVFLHPSIAIRAVNTSQNRPCLPVRLTIKKPIRLSLPCKWKQVVTWHETNHSPYLPRIILVFCRSRWPRGLRRRSAAARLLNLWVRFFPGLKCLSLVSIVCCQVEVSAAG